MRRLTLSAGAALVTVAVAACGGGASAGSSSQHASTSAGTTSADTATTGQATRGGNTAGGSAHDRAQIARLITAYGKRPTLLCTTYATPAMLVQQFGSKSACLKAASLPGAPDPGAKVTSIVITGNTAVATRVSTQPKGFKSNIFLVKAGAGWKVRASLPVPP